MPPLSYHRLAEQARDRARASGDPVLIETYTRLAVAYEALARFHERQSVLIAARRLIELPADQPRLEQPLRRRAG